MLAANALWISNAPFCGVSTSGGGVVYIHGGTTRRSLGVGRSTRRTGTSGWTVQRAHRMPAHGKCANRRWRLIRRCLRRWRTRRWGWRRALVYIAEVERGEELYELLVVIFVGAAVTCHDGRGEEKNLQIWSPGPMRMKKHLCQRETNIRRHQKKMTVLIRWSHPSLGEERRRKTSKRRSNSVSPLCLQRNEPIVCGWRVEGNKKERSGSGLTI
jgi:hypothetical protein